MIEFKCLASVLMRRCKVDRATALSAIASAYLTADRSRSDAEVSAYILAVAPKRLWIDRPHETPVSRLEYDPTSDIKTSADEESDGAFILRATKTIPNQYRLATAVVMVRLLKARERKPLSIEMTRQYIKSAGLPEASEQARQVFTYLTTRRSYDH